MSFLQILILTKLNVDEIDCQKQCRKVLMFQGWSIYGWARDDFPLMFIVKDRLLNWSTTLMLNTYLHLWRGMWGFLCVSHPLTPCRKHLKHCLQCFVKEICDSVLPVN